MYYAVQLFITRYQHILKPGTKIFRLLQSITDEQHIHLEPQKFQFQIFVDVVTKFNTNLPKVKYDLEQYGEIRNFDFTNLANKLRELLPDCENIFLDD